MQLHKRHLNILTISFSLWAAIGLSGSAEGQEIPSNAHRVAIAQRLISAFRATRSLDTIEAAMNALSGFNMRYETAATCVATRRETARSWTTLISAINEARDPTFDVTDESQLPTANVDVPGPSQYPSGTDPSDVKDPQVRAAYERLIAENSQKTRRLNYQLALRDDAHYAVVKLSILIYNTSSQCPRDDAALRTIVQNADITKQQRAEALGAGR
jgi:hypothetical protein